MGIGVTLSGKIGHQMVFNDTAFVGNGDTVLLPGIFGSGAPVFANSSRVAVR